MTHSINTLVIGAGVVGLAIARSLSENGRSVYVIEKNTAIGQETSSRNSEVIHAGIHYPPDSLKARLCVTGKEALYRYCAEKHIAHERIGKLIVAVSAEQVERLHSIVAQARRNGVLDLAFLDQAALKLREPNLSGVAALHSPSTGILDTHAFMLALQADIESAGGEVALRSNLVDTVPTEQGIRCDIDFDGERDQLVAKEVINSAGLHAAELASMLSQDAPGSIPEYYFAKGNYFDYAGPTPFSQLVYPLPMAGGLGIHATLDLAHRLRFGPDVEWVDSPDYQVDPARAQQFVAAIREYWPDVEAARLRPAYAGVRPKLAAPGAPAADFRIEKRALGANAVTVQLLGIESPGLTASLAIGDYVRSLLDR